MQTNHKKAGLAILRRSVIGRTRRAMVKGLLPFPCTLKCVDCGSKAYCYDHRDYLDPLRVEPVCRRCNRKRGPAAVGPDILVP